MLSQTGAHREMPANGRNATTRSSISCRAEIVAFAFFRSVQRQRPPQWRGIEEQPIPPPLTTATFILDLLCIHPFRDGNGRVSRLVTSLILHLNGFQVARYISLERLIEESKEEYYRVLKPCSLGWHENKNEILPSWNYFLGLIRNAYKEFEDQVELVEARPAKGDLVRQTILTQVEEFTLSDLSSQLPAASSQLIKKILAQMQQNAEVRLTGRGRGARWKLVGHKFKH
jgi:Fic family protein